MLNLRRVFQAVYFLKVFKTKQINVFLDHIIPASLPDSVILIKTSCLTKQPTYLFRVLARHVGTYLSKQSNNLLNNQVSDLVPN